MYNPTDLLYTQRCANTTNILYTQHFLLKIRNSKISQKTEKNGPTHKPRHRAFAKIFFIIAIQPFHWCRQNPRKNITVTVSVRVSATVRVSLVLFVSGNTFGASSVAICRRCVYKILVAFAQRCVYSKSCILHKVVYIISGLI